MTVQRAAAQSTLTNSLPMRWAVSFTEPVTGFDASDLTRGGTSTGGTVDVTGSGASYEITLNGAPTDGTVSFSIAADRAHDAAGNGNTSSDCHRQHGRLRRDGAVGDGRAGGRARRIRPTRCLCGGP